jgi:hypothetical protein
LVSPSSSGSGSEKIPRPDDIREYLKAAQAAVDELPSLKDLKAAATALAGSELADASGIGTTLGKKLKKFKKDLRGAVKILESMLAESLETEEATRLRTRRRS